MQTAEKIIEVVFPTKKNSYSAPAYNYDNYSESPNPKLKFHSKTDSVELFGYNITNSMFYTSENISDLPFAINKKSIPNFCRTQIEALGY